MRKSETFEFTPVDELVPEDATVPDEDRAGGGWAPDPTVGELQLEERSSLRRVAGLSTELTDVTEVEYRQLRLERVVLVGVWTELAWRRCHAVSDWEATHDPRDHPARATRAPRVRVRAAIDPAAGPPPHPAVS